MSSPLESAGPPEEATRLGRVLPLTAVPGPHGPDRSIGSIGVGFRLGGEQTGGQVAIVEHPFPPGALVPPHVHTREDEFFYVLDGTFEVRIGDDVHALEPGGFAFVPRGTVHNFRNTAGTPSRILVGFTPGGMDGFFRDSGRPAVDDGPPPPLDDDEIARTTAAAERYGVRALGF